MLSNKPESKSKRNIKYVWTKKAEITARELGLDARKEGDTAKYGYDILKAGLQAAAWLEKGYIREVIY